MEKNGSSEASDEMGLGRGFAGGVLIEGSGNDRRVSRLFYGSGFNLDPTR